jgi:UDP-glucuronate 4-epimerase
VFNYGEMSRDFTYVDDITEGVIKVIDNPAAPNPAWQAKNPTPESSSAPYRVYNIGNNQPVSLMAFIETIEKKLGKKAQKEMLPMQPGDVESTYADVSDLIKDMGYKPDTPLDEGVENFVAWYREFYRI